MSPSSGALWRQFYRAMTTRTPRSPGRIGRQALGLLRGLRAWLHGRRPGSSLVLMIQTEKGMAADLSATAWLGSDANQQCQQGVAGRLGLQLVENKLPL